MLPKNIYSSSCLTVCDPAEDININAVFFFFFASYLFTPNDTNNIRMCAKPLNYACVYKFSLFVVIDLHSGVQLKLLSYMMFDK